jgi:hypothetical protein
MVRGTLIVQRTLRCELCSISTQVGGAERQVPCREQVLSCTTQPHQSQRVLTSGTSKFSISPWSLIPGNEVEEGPSNLSSGLY